MACCVWMLHKLLNSWIVGPLLTPCFVPLDIPRHWLGGWHYCLPPWIWALVTSCFWVDVRYMTAVFWGGHDLSHPWTDLTVASGQEAHLLIHPPAQYAERETLGLGKKDPFGRPSAFYRKGIQDLGNWHCFMSSSSSSFWGTRNLCFWKLPYLPFLWIKVLPADKCLGSLRATLLWIQKHALQGLLLDLRPGVRCGCEHRVCVCADMYVHRCKCVQGCRYGRHVCVYRECAYM